MLYHHCKNCGSKLEDGASHCTQCGVPIGTGETHCGNCGKEVAPGQAICMQCGFFLREVEAREADSHKKKKPEYQAQAMRFKKATILSLIAQICGLVAILTLIFAPIYIARVEFDYNDLDSLLMADQIKELSKWNDLQNLDKDPEFMENGTVKLGFSLFDDIKIILDGILDGGGDPMSLLISVASGMMAIFEIIFAVIVAIAFGKKIYQLIQRLVDPQDDLMLTFNEIKKTGNVEKKVNIFKQQSIVTVLLYLAMDFLDGKYLNALLFQEVDVDFPIRNMTTCSGFSNYIILTLVFLVGYFIADSMKKKEEKAMRVEIVETQYNEA